MATRKITINDQFPEIPSRSEFHRYYSGDITVSDFNGDYLDTPGVQINHAAAALNWTRNMDAYRKILEASREINPFELLAEYSNAYESGNNFPIESEVINRRIN